MTSFYIRRSESYIFWQPDFLPPASASLAPSPPFVDDSEVPEPPSSPPPVFESTASHRGVKLQFVESRGQIASFRPVRPSEIPELLMKLEDEVQVIVRFGETYFRHVRLPSLAVDKEPWHTVNLRVDLVELFSTVLVMPEDVRIRRDKTLRPSVVWIPGYDGLDDPDRWKNQEEEPSEPGSESDSGSDTEPWDGSDRLVQQDEGTVLVSYKELLAMEFAEGEDGDHVYDGGVSDSSEGDSGYGEESDLDEEVPDFGDALSISFISIGAGGHPKDGSATAGPSEPDLGCISSLLGYLSSDEEVGASNYPEDDSEPTILHMMGGSSGEGACGDGDTREEEVVDGQDPSLSTHLDGVGIPEVDIDGEGHHGWRPADEIGSVVGVTKGDVQSTGLGATTVEEVVASAGAETPLQRMFTSVLQFFSQISFLHRSN
jgi:hypothetical protein